MTAFAGFPPETIWFLRELQANNRKDWFDAHRGDYETYWVAPAKAFVVAAGRQLAELVPQIRAEPRVLGSILRINQLGGAALKRPPAGFTDDGPARRFLLHKALFVHHDEPADERIENDAVLATCMRHWRALAPLHRWLTDNVRAS
jgi:hypothetical protein